MITARGQRHRFGRFAALLAGALASGCGVSFDSGSKVNTLRVFAVQKDKPYSRPGESVSLQLLWHDPARDADPSLPPPRIGWIAACNNPDGDLYELCFAQFSQAALAGGLRPEDYSFPEPGSIDANDRISVTVPEDIISSRPPPKDPGLLPYGLSYVFFAVCTGELALDPNGGFPLLCYREQDGVDGFGSGDALLGSEDFIVGYTALFVYDAIGNQNPIVTGIQLNGTTFVSESASGTGPEGAELLAERDLCIGASCTTPAPEDAEAICPASLTFPACDGCDELPLQPFVDPASAEVDDIASILNGSDLGEQMWINYYSSLGEVDDEVRLLNDATKGWSDNFGSDYAVGTEPGVGYLWAVAHDNRGGAEWLRLRLCIE